MSGLFENVFLTKGYLRSTVVDTWLKELYFVSNEFASFVDDSGKIKVQINESESASEFFDYLVANGCISDYPANEFQPIDHTFRFPSHFQMATLCWNDFNPDTIERIERFLKAIQSYYCQIYIHDPIDLPSISAFVNSSIVFYFELILLRGGLVAFAEELAKISSRVKVIKVYNSSKNSTKSIEGYCKLITYKQDFLSVEYRTAATKLFSLTLMHYIEGRSYNTYFNSKVHINAQGQVYPTIEFDLTGIQPLGTINDPAALLMERLNSTESNPYRFALKSIMDVCADCEFQNVCTDNRLPTQRQSDGQWYHTSECNYNPYIAKWKGEEGYRTLAECGVKSDETGFSIDHERIATINEELWGSPL